MRIPPGKVLADRYRFISLFPSRSGAVTAWRAMDLAFDEEVVVYFLSGDPAPTSEEAAAFEMAFARASHVPRSGTVGWHALDLESGLAVREWVNGFTLHELLRRRRRISVSETLSLLSRLPNTLDATCESGMTAPGDLLRETWVAFEPEFPVSHLISREPSEWPRHHTKLTVMRLRDFWRHEGDGAELVTEQPRIDSEPIWIRLARVICELLGGRIRNEGRMPLPALNEKANELIRETFDGKKWNSAGHFWTAFEADAVETKTHIGAIRQARKPLAFSAATDFQAAPCRVAALVPRGKTNPAIHLCAGTEFRFGRSSVTEFPTIILPQTPENEKIAGEIGRVQVQLEAREGALWIRDGNGEAASRNGTQWDGVALPGNTPVAFRGRGVLSLANQCKLALKPIVTGAPAVTIGPMKVEFPLPVPWCAVVPIPMDGLKFAQRSVWVLTMLEFNLDKNGDIQWRQGEYFEPSGIFVRMNGGFYVGNIAFPSEALRVSDTEIPEGRAIPLFKGQRLQIGQEVYDVSTGD